MVSHCLQVINFFPLGSEGRSDGQTTKSISVSMLASIAISTSISVSIYLEYLFKVFRCTISTILAMGC